MRAYGFRAEGLGLRSQGLWARREILFAQRPWPGCRDVDRPQSAKLSPFTGGLGSRCDSAKSPLSLMRMKLLLASFNITLGLESALTL